MSYRYLTPAGHLEVCVGDRRIDAVAYGRRLFFVGRQEHRAGGETGGELHAGFRADGTEEALRELDQQAAAVAGLAIGTNGAAVRQPCQRGDGGRHNPVALRIVEVRNETEAAAVAFELRVVKASRFGHCHECSGTGLKASPPV